MRALSDIVLRNVKGSPLTFSELDSNFAGLNVELFDLGKQIYRPVASASTLPDVPADGDLVELLDSTGVQSSVAIVGVPTGFTGDDTLSVRLRYSSASGKWAWVDYASKAPDARYERLTIETAKQALAGLSSVEFSGVPSWAKKITVVVSGVSANANRFCVQLGTSSGYVTSGYTGSTAFLPYGFPTPGCYRINSSIGFIFVENGTINGKLQIWQVASNLWVGTGVSIGGTYGTCWPHGLVSLTGRLTSLRLLAGVSTEHLGTGSFSTPGQAFTAGTVNVFYEGQLSPRLPGDPLFSIIAPYPTTAGFSPSVGIITMGNVFTLQESRPLQGVGIWAANTTDHSVGIWDYTNVLAPVLVWSTNILGGDNGVVDNFYRWFAISNGPMLTQNVPYIIAATWIGDAPVLAGDSVLGFRELSLIPGSALGHFAASPLGAVTTEIVDFATHPETAPTVVGAGGANWFIPANVRLGAGNLATWTPLLDFTGGTAILWGENDAYGVSFTLSSDQVIKGVGIYDHNGDGLSQCYFFLTYFGMDILDPGGLVQFTDPYLCEQDQYLPGGAITHWDLIAIDAGAMLPLVNNRWRVFNFRYGSTLSAGSYTLLQSGAPGNSNSVVKNATITTMNGVSGVHAMVLPPFASTPVPVAGDDPGYFGPILFLDAPV